MKVSISNGNSKMGLIKSVSLPPVVTCATGCTCAKKCYAAKLSRIYPSVKKSYSNNLECYCEDVKEYFRQIKVAAANQRFFRWHVAGDIPDGWYFNEMVKLALELPLTRFLCFTKQYSTVNWFLDADGVIPDNLTVIFSEWPGMECDNRHNLPTSQVIFKGEQEPEVSYVCTGNCMDCALNELGCWTLKHGETVAFHEH